MRAHIFEATADLLRAYTFEELRVGDICRIADISKPTFYHYATAGITTILYADGDWLPMLPYPLELPRGCCHAELDGATDIEAAYDILCDHHSIRGDVPTTMFAFGTVDEVSEYCEKLVAMGTRNGFMPSSGCEVSTNTKPENLKAFISFLK